MSNLACTLWIRMKRNSLGNGVLALWATNQSLCQFMVSNVFLVGDFVPIDFSLVGKVLVVACYRCMFVGVERYCPFVFCLLWRGLYTCSDTTINDEQYVVLVSSTMRNRRQQKKKNKERRAAKDRKSIR